MIISKFPANIWRQIIRNVYLPHWYWSRCRSNRYNKCLICRSIRSREE